MWPRLLIVWLVSQVAVVSAEKAPANWTRPHNWETPKLRGIGGHGYFSGTAKVGIKQGQFLPGSNSNNAFRSQPQQQSSSNNNWQPVSLPMTSSSPPSQRSSSPTDSFHHFWQTAPSERPRFDTEGRKWVCPNSENPPVDFLHGNGGGASTEVRGVPREERNNNKIETPQEQQPYANKASMPIPLSKARFLDQRADESNYNSVYQNVTGIRIRTPPPAAIAGSLFGTRMDVAKVPEAAKPAFCQPENRTVSLELPSGPNVFYYPTCTRLERCGGCCSHELLECQPTRSEILRLTVIKTEYRDGEMKFAGNETVAVERHLKCSCDCRIKERDCHEGQLYLPHECRCMCKNSNSEHTCTSRGSSSSSERYWDPNTCSCKCKNVHECSTGMEYNHDRCRCEAAVIPIIPPVVVVHATQGRDYGSRRPLPAGGGASRLLVMVKAVQCFVSATSIAMNNIPEFLCERTTSVRSRTAVLNDSSVAAEADTAVQSNGKNMQLNFNSLDEN